MMHIALTIGDRFPEEVNVVVEIPQGSAVKYEIDHATGMVRVDRFLHTSMVYPYNYGFIPQTKGEDGDPLDVLLLSEQSVVPGCVVTARPIGLLEMEDEAGGDVKILAVPARSVDPWYAQVEDVKDLDGLTRERIRHFFSYYKELEDEKWVKVKGFAGRDIALDLIRTHIER